MKRKTLAIAALALLSSFAVTAPVSAVDLSQDTKKTALSLDIFKLAQPAATIKVEQPKPPEPKPAPEPPKPVEHVAVEGDNLSKIAEAHKTTWLRLWQKNTAMQHPDVLKVGDKISIPLADEQLAERALPTPPPVPVMAAAPQPAAPAPAPARTYSRPEVNSAGNTYTYGYCTWYVKNRRPDIPNSWGHAETWYYRAANMGWPVGSSPRAGAIGTRGNHVVYVERVNGDGTILISEMNYQGWNVQSSRTVPAGNFNYIY